MTELQPNLIQPAIVQKPKKKKHHLRYDQQKVAVSWLFLLPCLIGFIIFFVYPLIMSFIYSFSTLDLSALAKGESYIHFGQAFTESAIKNNDYSNPITGWYGFFYNYIYALTINADYPVQLWTTFYTTVLDTAVITIFSLLIAVMLNGKFRGRTIVRAIFFLPVILNSEAVSQATEAASALSNVLNQDNSALTNLFDMKVFLQGVFGNKAWANTLIGFLSGITTEIYNTISYSGIQILIFLAAIQSVPAHLYEAAKMEGATKYEMFWKITLPMVSPMIVTVVVYTIVDSFLRSKINNVIDLQYKNSQYGYHAAMSWIYLLVSGLLLLIVVGILSKVVFYYDDKK